MLRSVTAILAALAALLVLPATARAQWYFDGYLGASRTRPADVSVDQPSTQLAIDYLDVEFAGESFTTPPYYGWRVGRRFGARERFGLEFEFLHVKVIADTSQQYETRDRSGLLDLMAPGPMSDLVERYSMTHGLNFLFVNAVYRQPFGGGRHALVARVGAGPTMPHAESTVLGQPQEQYEYAGPGAQAAAGATIGVWERVSAIAEYKLTFARPEITLAVDGVGHTTTLTHQIAFGFSIALSR